MIKKAKKRNNVSFSDEGFDNSKKSPNGRKSNFLRSKF